MVQMPEADLRPVGVIATLRSRATRGVVDALAFRCARLFMSTALAFRHAASAGGYSVRHCDSKRKDQPTA